MANEKYVVTYTDEDGAEVEKVFDSEEAAKIFAAGVDILLGGENEEDDEEPMQSKAPSRSASRSEKRRTPEAWERSMRSHMQYAHRAITSAVK